jgi:hypothetical protein
VKITCQNMNKDKHLSDVTKRSLIAQSQKYTIFFLILAKLNEDSALDFYSRGYPVQISSL